MTVDQVGAAAVAVTAAALTVAAVGWWLLRDLNRALTLPDRRAGALR